MARTRPTATEERDSYHQLLVDIWNEVDECDGSPQEQRQTLDNIHGLIESEIPDVSEFETSDQADQDDGDIDSEDDE